MKCENGDYVIPETFYVFVGYGDDLGSAVNAHNYAIDHRLVATAVSCFIRENERNAYLDGTIAYRPCEEAHHGRPAIKALSSFALSHRDDAVENWLETVRSEKYPKLPSRFASLFAFGDMDACRRVSRRYGWDISTVRQFCLVDLGPHNDLVRISRHNMEIVSFLRACDLPCVGCRAWLRSTAFCRRYEKEVENGRFNNPGVRSNRNVASKAELSGQCDCGHLFVYPSRRYKGVYIDGGHCRDSRWNADVR